MSCRPWACTGHIPNVFEPDGEVLGQRQASIEKLLAKTGRGGIYSNSQVGKGISQEGIESMPEPAPDPAPLTSTVSSGLLRLLVGKAYNLRMSTAVLQRVGKHCVSFAVTSSSTSAEMSLREQPKTQACVQDAAWLPAGRRPSGLTCGAGHRSQGLPWRPPLTAEGPQPPPPLWSLLSSSPLSSVQEAEVNLLTLVLPSLAVWV